MAAGQSLFDATEQRRADFSSRTFEVLAFKNCAEIPFPVQNPNSAAAMAAEPTGDCEPMPAINLAAKLATFSEHFTPKIVGSFNGHDVMLAKLKGPSSGTRIPTPMISSSSSRAA